MIQPRRRGTGWSIVLLSSSFASSFSPFAVFGSGSGDAFHPGHPVRIRGGSGGGTSSSSSSSSSVASTASRGGRRRMSHFSTTSGDNASGPSSSSSSSTDEAAAPSLTRFGLIADTQYADAEDAPNYVGNRLRRYRQSLSTLCSAVHRWNALPARGERPLDFAVELGDMFDGKARGSRWKCLADVKGVLNLAAWTPPPQAAAFSPPSSPPSSSFSSSSFSSSSTNSSSSSSSSSSGTGTGTVGQWHCCIGNHELYCFSREELQRELLLSAPSPKKLYYDFSPSPGLRFVVLDGYDVSTIAAADGEEGTQRARALLYNKNYNINDQNVGGGGEWLLGVIGDQRRFLPYNGALGQEQLEWFEAVLQRASGKQGTAAGAAAAGAAAAASSSGGGGGGGGEASPREKVVVFCHMPVYAACSNFNNLLWNYESVQRLLRRHPDVVVAWFAGHDHDGGYAVDPSTGIHHVIPCAPLECGAGEVSFGHVDAFVDRLEITWSGKTPYHGPSDTGLKEPWPKVLPFRTPLPPSAISTAADSASANANAAPPGSSRSDTDTALDGQTAALRARL